MPTHVYANNNEIASKASEGKSIAAFPDVCFSPPAPPVGPMPLPYPNTGEATNTDKGTSKVFIKDKMSGMEGDSNFSKSMGDESATQNFNKGMITSALQGKCYFGLWSMDVQMEGKGVPRHLDMVTHNHGSMSGQSAGSDIDNFFDGNSETRVRESKSLAKKKRTIRVKKVEMCDNKKIVPCSKVTFNVTEFNYSDVTDEEKREVKWKIARKSISGKASTIETVVQPRNNEATLTFKLCNLYSENMEYTVYPFINEPSSDVSISFTMKSMENIRKEINISAFVITRKIFIDKSDTGVEKDCDYKCIVIHHAGDSYTADSSPAKVYNSDLGGIPYHYIINSKGIIYEGRSILHKGSHTAGGNSKRIGICFLGDFASSEESSYFDNINKNMNPNSLSRRSLKRLITVLISYFNITHLCGHRELANLIGKNSTVCPGNNLMPLVREIRNQFRFEIPERANVDLRDNNGGCV